MTSRVEKSRRAEKIMHCSMHFVVVAVVVVAFSTTPSANSFPKLVGTFPSELPHGFGRFLVCAFVTQG